MLALTPSVYDGMLEHARGGGDREVCGILGGTYGAERSRAVTAHRTENVADTPRTTYRIDPAEQLEVMEAIEAAGREVVGFYHSHPRGPPGPSSTDAARATWPGYSYLIVDCSGEYPAVDSWRWTGETFARETVTVR